VLASRNPGRLEDVAGVVRWLPLRASWLRERQRRSRSCLGDDAEADATSQSNLSILGSVAPNEAIGASQDALCLGTHAQGRFASGVELPRFGGLNPPMARVCVARGKRERHDRGHSPPSLLTCGSGCGDCSSLQRSSKRSRLRGRKLTGNRPTSAEDPRRRARRKLYALWREPGKTGHSGREWNRNAQRTLLDPKSY
jgi:hypothetical protein